MKAIKNGKIVTVTKGIIEGGTILIDQGKIVAVGQDLPIPEGTRVIDASGKWVTPGLIDCHTHISTFPEPSTMPAPTGDANEMSDPVTPHIRAIDAVNPHDYAFAKTLMAGFTTIYTGPGSGNLIGGVGVSVKLRGKTADEMAIPGSGQMKMALGENAKRAFGADRKAPMTRMGCAAVIREALWKARNYSDKLRLAETDPSKKPDFDFKLEALVPVVRRQQKVRIHSHRSDDIATAIRIAEEFDLDFAIEHVTEGYKIVEHLAAKNPYCVVGPMLIPPKKQELWDIRMENPGILSKAGIKVCLTADAASETQWLPVHAGLAVRYGMDAAEAFKGITLYPAELLGLADRMGSLEVGKDADIAIFDGDPICNLTTCEVTMIDGEVCHAADPALR